MRFFIITIFLLNHNYSFPQSIKYPVIDVHVHVYSKDVRWEYHVPNPVTKKPLTADNAQKHYEATMAEMKKWNYKKAVISGDTAAQWLWKKRNPEFFITGLSIDSDFTPDLVWLEEAFKTGKVQVVVKICFRSCPIYYT